jgi:hypothetical protein
MPKHRVPKIIRELRFLLYEKSTRNLLYKKSTRKWYRFSEVFKMFLPTLLRDAQPTARELEEDETARARARIAHDTFVWLYLDYMKRGKLDQLDLRIRNTVELPIIRDCLQEHPMAEAEEVQAFLRSNPPPQPKGGCPIGAHTRRLDIAIRIQEAIEAREALGKERVTDLVLREIAATGIEKPGDVSYDYLKEIHYDPDLTWRLGVKAERAFRAEWKGHKGGGGAQRSGHMLA